jgi:hypothetical protein
MLDFSGHVTLSAFIKPVDAVILRLRLWSQNILVYQILGWHHAHHEAWQWPREAAEGQVLCASAHSYFGMCWDQLYTVVGGSI